MADIGLGFIMSSFIAGVFTFLAPCTLPLIPAFLGVISGIGHQELNNPEKLKTLRWRIFSNAFFYVLGFSLVFISFGVAFSLLGKIFLIRVWLERLGGLLIILFGLSLIGWLKLPWLNNSTVISAPSLYQKTSKINSFSIGALFALGWSPCVGPLLGSIFLLASSSTTIHQGTLLLAVFSLGLALPFLVTALLIGKVIGALASWGKFLQIINMIAGISLIMLGILLFSNQFGIVFGTIQGYFYRFQFYEEFINKFF